MPAAGGTAFSFSPALRCCLHALPSSARISRLPPARFALFSRNPPRRPAVPRELIPRINRNSLHVNISSYRYERCDARYGSIYCAIPSAARMRLGLARLLYPNNHAIFTYNIIVRLPRSVYKPRHKTPAGARDAGSRSHYYLPERRSQLGVM